MKTNREFRYKDDTLTRDPAAANYNGNLLLRPALVVLFLLTAALLSAFGSPEHTQPQQNGLSSTLALPSPRSDGELSLEETLNRRGVDRHYSQQPLSLAPLYYSGRVSLG